MNFAVLDPVADAAQWDGLFERLPSVLRDLHFSSAYARIQNRIDQRALLAVYEWEGAFVMQPFAVRSVEIGGAVVSDIANLYGYGGPICNRKWLSVPSLYLWFMHEWKDWLKEQNIVCEFCVLHPLLQVQQHRLISQGGMPLVMRKHAVMMGLDSDEMMLSGMQRNRMRGVRKAQNFGVWVEDVEANVENQMLFASMYGEQMQRLEAVDQWRFPDSYLAAHFTELKTNARLLFARTMSGELESALLMLVSGRTSYAHFLGSRRIYTNLAVDDLLYFEAARLARSLGCLGFHLGGGRGTSLTDSLLVYKRAFGGQLLPVSSYFRVFDQRLYDALCEGVDAESGYLPLYRSAQR